jgi:hypothetical protein
LRKEFTTDFTGDKIQKETMDYGILRKVWGPTHCGFGFLWRLWGSSIGSKRNNNIRGGGGSGNFTDGHDQRWHD